MYNFVSPGAATDVRLSVNENFEWFDNVSLRSRIFVAAGGGSSEWKYSIGGNGGGLTGTRGYSDCGRGGFDPDVITAGGNQTSGGNLSGFCRYEASTELNGLFGRSSVVSGDMGGIGGSGYYAGASVSSTGAGGGGSSFISGHEGCIAIKSDSSEEPSNTSIHYSNIFFSQTKMIVGNNTMPLYYSPSSRGIGNTGQGAFRVTILGSFITCANNVLPIFQSRILIYVFIFMSESD